jgi:phytoene dehydrogenase-like protein
MGIREMADYDAIIIGSGHNALVCALCLADVGWKVLVLERSADIGGALRTQELTLPGFKHDLCATNVGRFALSPVHQQFRSEFAASGLRFLTNTLPYASVYPDGGVARAFVDPALMEREVTRYLADDVAGWHEVSALFRRLSPALLALQIAAMPSRDMLRHIGHIVRHSRDAFRLLRILVQSPRAFLEQYFRSPQIKGLILPWSFHSDFGPETMGGAMFSFITAFSAQHRGLGIAAGGAGNITTALQTLLERRGGAVRAWAEVSRIYVKDGRAVSVRTHDGNEFSAARAIVAGVTPRHLFGGLIHSEELPHGFRRRIGRFRYGIGTFVVHLALDKKLDWRAADDLAAFNTVHINGDAETLSRTYQESRDGLIPSRPLLIVSQTTHADPFSGARRQACRAHSFARIPRGNSR